MIVVKVGGGLDVDYAALCDDIAALSAQGQQLFSSTADRVRPTAWPRLSVRRRAL
jgi:hypothetical protein